MNQQPNPILNAAAPPPGGFGPPGGGFGPPGGGGFGPPGGGAYGPPGGGVPPGAPPGQPPGGGFGAPPGQPAGFGAPPGQPAGFGAPPGQPAGFGAPPGQPAGFGAPPAGQAGGFSTGEKKTSTLAIVSLITGILSLLPCCNFYILWLVAIVTGFLARKEIRSKPDQLKGEGMALGGIIMGAFGFVVIIIITILQLTTSLFSALM